MNRKQHHFKRTLACLMVVIMALSAVPMSGFVGLELPEWSEMFATKAGAEDELTPEDCVDIYMDNSYVWLKRDTDKYDYTYYYSFLDLDFDGVLEMLRTQEVQGTGFFTYNAYFKSSMLLRLYKIKNRYFRFNYNRSRISRI